MSRNGSAAIPNGGRKRLLWLSLGILVLDQSTKLVAHETLRDRASVEVVPGCLNLVYSTNPGGLFGFFRDWPDPVRHLLLVVLPLVAVGVISWMLLRGQQNDRVLMLALAFILGGAVGNLVDRVIRGEVIDFIDFYISHPRLAEWLVDTFGTAHWHTFNIADSAIVCGASLVLLSSLRREPSSVEE